MHIEWQFQRTYRYRTLSMQLPKFLRAILLAHFSLGMSLQLEYKGPRELGTALLVLYTLKNSSLFYTQYKIIFHEFSFSAD